MTSVCRLSAAQASRLHKLQDKADSPIKEHRRHAWPGHCMRQARTHRLGTKGKTRSQRSPDYDDQ